MSQNHLAYSNWKNRLLILGQRQARNSPCCIVFPAVFNEMSLLTAGPLIGVTAGVSSRICTVTNESKSLTYAAASSFLCTSPLAVVTVDGFLDTQRTVSSSAKFRSFLPSMCTEAPESTTNCLSSGFLEDGAGRHQVSEGEKNGDYAHENRCAESHLAMDPFFLSRIFMWCNAFFRIARCALVTRTLCPSAKSNWISAAQYPGIRDLIAWNSSTSQHSLFPHLHEASLPVLLYLIHFRRHGCRRGVLTGNFF